MPRDAADTRRKLLDAAAQAFADHGIRGASMLDITRQAGQRNRGALHYHFGSRQGVLCAVLEEHADFLASREGELLDAARQTPADELEPVVEAVVRPAAELARSGWRGRCFLVILAELAEEDPSTLSPEVTAVLDRTGGHAVYALLADRLPPLPDEVRVERLSLMTAFILRAVADRARLLATGTGDEPAHGLPSGRPRVRPQLDDEAFVRNLVAMAAAAVAAPDRIGALTAGNPATARRAHGTR